MTLEEQINLTTESQNGSNPSETAEADPCKLYIGNLPVGTTEEQVSSLLEHLGESPVSVKVHQTKLGFLRNRRSHNQPSTEETAAAANGESAANESANGGDQTSTAATSTPAPSMFAFATFATPEGASSTLEKCNGFKFQDNELQASLARPPRSGRQRQNRRRQQNNQTSDEDAEGANQEGKQQGRKTGHKRHSNYSRGNNGYRRMTKDTVYVKNLDTSVGVDKLLGLFKGFTISKITVPEDIEDPTKFRGYGFVRLSSMEERDRAIEQLRNTEFCGSTVTVSKAYTRRPPFRRSTDPDQNKESDLNGTGVDESNNNVQVQAE